MICYEEAVAIIRSCGEGRRLETESVALEAIAGGTCAQAVTAPMANQPFDNSAMDGYALHSAALEGATPETPVILDVIGRVVAGERTPEQSPLVGQCYEIMTGAPMPPNCDCVVPVENAELQGDKVVFFEGAESGRNVRLTGADFAADELILNTGTRLDLRHILPLATLGVSQVKVVRKPRVAVLSTGLEVIDDLDQPLQSGQIYNASAPYIRQMLPALGAEASFFGTVADEVSVFRDKLDEMMASGADILVTTGAVSAGVCDFIRRELEAKGAQIMFHKVKMRPGKPILFAKFPNGGPLFVGLPGNPVASAAGLRFFVYPLMRAMQGLPPEQPKHGVLKRGSNNKKAEFRMFLRAVSRHTDNTTREIEILPKQQSFMVSAFMAANAWAVATEGVADIREGDLVDFYPFLPE
ncbi:Molybdopterin biosynthesis protein MoeA [gamma proteobacterium IMCC2047]|nr:Molybdopterin biosynthesis protein MoeA [gamma proteobacterium IMCC2047]